MATILSIDESPSNQLDDITLPGSGDVITALNTYFGNTTWTSGVLQAAKKTGLLSGLTNTIDLSLTNSTGGNLSGVDSGLNDINGNDILLYTDTTNNNLVLGKVGTTVVFAIYLDATGSSTDAGATGADLWMVMFQDIQHPDGSDPNDFVSISNAIYTTVTNPIHFDATGAPSGNNLFLMFGDGTPTSTEVVCIATAVDAADQSSGENISSGKTVKTSQGGLPGGTFGVDSQMLDPLGGGTGEALYFTFVTGANLDYVVTPNKELTPTEADIEANIDFDNFFGAHTVSFQISQLQPGSGKATIEIDALLATPQAANGAGVADDTPYTGNDYIPNQETNTSVDIDTVTITRVVTVHKVQTTFTWVFVEGSPPPTGAGVTVDFSANGGNGVIISGLLAGDKIEYTTVAEHDRLQITNIGSSDPALNASCDVGNLTIVAGGTTSTLLPPIDVYDDGPTANGTAVTATVDEDGATLGLGNPGGTDDSSANSTATGSISGIFSAGSDGLQTYGLATDTTGLPALTSQGATVKYDVDTSTQTLTAYVELGGNANDYDSGTDRKVFTLVLSGTNNATYTFTLFDQLDHAAPAAGTSFENELTLNLGSVLMITDKDNDTKTAGADKLVITVDDDSPQINSGTTNISVANGSSGTGKFSYSIGLDDRDTYTSLSTSDLIVSLGGTVGGNAITSPSVTFGSETDLQATFNFSFTYISNPTTNATTVDTGSIVFDKVNGTYTVSLTNPITSFSVISLNTALGFTGYVEGSSTVDSSQPDVSVAQLASNFFVQFRAYEEPSGNGLDKPGSNDNIDAVLSSVAWSPTVQPADDDAFLQGEIFQSSRTWPSVQNDTAGIASDTIQHGEVLDFNFFTSDPHGFANPAGVQTATTSTMFIEFDGLDNGEDLVVLLKLVDSANPTNVITVPVICQYGDIFHAAQQNQIPAAFGFTGTLDQNDGLVVIEGNDYNFLPGATGTWRIAGAQVLPSTEGITATNQAIDLNGAIGGASSSTLVSFSTTQDQGGNNGGTWDGDVFKIVNIGFTTDVTPNAQLNFDVAVKDFDGDTTGTQTLTVNLAGSSTFSGTSSSDTFVMTDIAADSDLVLSAPTRVINGFNPLAPNADVLDFTTDADGTNFTGAGSFASLAAFITAANTALDGTIKYYFGTVGGDGYLAYDGDGTDMTALIKLVGVTTNFDHTDIV